MQKQENLPGSKKYFQKISKLRPVLQKIAKTKGTPLFVFDGNEVKENLKKFTGEFKKNKVDVNVFYAIKSNYYIDLLKTVVKNGGNLDASSKRELELAIKAGAKQIIYTGPAKTEKDFELILKHYSKITVNLESKRELELLAKMAAKRNITMRCGARVYTKMQKGWTKFGMPLEQLKNFFNEAKKYKSIKFCGIHFHISMNKKPDPYLKTLKEVARYVKTNFSAKEREKFEYIDMGGGYYPESFEGKYTWNKKDEMNIFDEGNLMDKIVKDKFKKRYIPVKVTPIETVVKKICEVYKKEVLPILPAIQLYAEPGRFVSHTSMHILLKIIDIKGTGKTTFGITDGGTNIVGWEKYQFFYYVPLINLSQFDLKHEKPFVVYGSLCTPDDIWGYYVYGGKAALGDILLIPFQGAYTYTLAQEFIKDIPKVYNLS